MACNKHMYTPVAPRQNKPVNLGLKKFDNKGYSSKIIK